MTDTELLDKLEEIGKKYNSMPHFSIFHGKWEWTPWKDCPRFLTLREAITYYERKETKK